MHRLVQKVRRAQLNDRSKNRARRFSAPRFSCQLRPCLLSSASPAAPNSRLPRQKPARCPICDEPRQFVPPSGQAWTTHESLVAAPYQFISAARARPHRHRQRARIRHRAARAVHSHRDGNVLWDCISLLDEATISIVKASRRPHRHRHLASALLRVDGGMGACLRRTHSSARRRSPMGHASRSSDQVLERRYAAAGPRRYADLLRRPLRRRHACCTGRKAGAAAASLLSGDIVQVIPDRKFVTFMRSYPNMIPLSAPSVERIGAMLEPYDFDVIHGAWFDRTIPHDGKEDRQTIDRALRRGRARRRLGRIALKK